jgi:hypothetical protein
VSYIYLCGFCLLTDVIVACVWRLPAYNDRRGHHGRMVALYLAFCNARAGRPHSVTFMSLVYPYVVLGCI